MSIMAKRGKCIHCGHDWGNDPIEEMLKRHQGGEMTDELLARLDLDAEEHQLSEDAAARIRKLTEMLRKRENAAAQDGQTPPLTAGVTSAASQEAQAAGPASAASSIRELEKQLEDQSNELSDARSGERKLIVQLEAERKAREEAERDYRDCQATLNDERYCHQQTITSVKTAASQEIKAANKRAETAEARVRAREEAERKLLDRTQWSEGDFDDKGIAPWDLSPHYENAVSELTRRKAYAKSDCAQMIAEGWKAAETAEARVRELVEELDLEWLQPRSGR